MATDHTTPADLEAAYAADPELRERLASFHARLAKGDVDVVPPVKAKARLRAALERGLKPPDPDDALELRE